MYRWLLSPRLVSGRTSHFDWAGSEASHLAIRSCQSGVVCRSLFSIPPIARRISAIFFCSSFA
jgi:hypothetical protein